MADARITVQITVDNRFPTDPPLSEQIFDALVEQGLDEGDAENGRDAVLAVFQAASGGEDAERNERRRLADLLDEHANEIGGSCKTPTAAVKLTALLLRLDNR